MSLRLTACVVGLLAGFGGPALHAAEPNPVGNWETTTGESRYKVSRCGNGQELCARLIWLRDDARTAENLALLNNYVLTGARQVEPNSWVGTVVYDGDTYSGSVAFKGDNLLTVRSCSGIFCQSYDLRRL
ncbi:DUF2147 domain-containing protein [Devosia sp.]|uniref:DUF2147 domain-containing protein n=1 Tax=Devosia sp. TaxID=1871048 RepID=UPI003A901DBE